MNFDDIKFVKLLPQFMRDDGCDQGIASALDDLIRRSFYNVRSLKVWDEIETLNEKQCDEMAWELDVDWYNSTMTLDEKRQTLKYAMSVKRKRGTPWSVQQLIGAYFGEGFVYEWTAFDGQPYTFMVLTTNTNTDEQSLKMFIDAVNSAKNERSRLIGVAYLWRQDHEAMEITSYNDFYHKYAIKKCGLTPRATTIGILHKGTMTAGDVSQYLTYALKGVKDDKCGRLGGHRGTIGQINKNTVLSSYDDETDNYSFKKSGLAKCSDTIGSLSRSGIAGAYDDNDLTYTLKRVKNRTILKQVTSNTKVATFSAVQFFNYKKCGLHRCRAQ